MHLLLIALSATLLLATLPLLLELLVLSAAAAFPSRPRAALPSRHIRLAVVIPAHNEQMLIAPCVASLAGADSIYVVAHNCTDETGRVARLAGAQVLQLDDRSGGKGLALDHGFRHALADGADAILVIDADSIAAPDLLSEVSDAFAAGASAVQSRYVVANSTANRRTRLAALAFLGMNVLRPLGRSRLGLSCGIFGNGFGLSAATLRAVPYTSNSLVEDLEYHLHLIRAGIRVEFLNHASVFGEMPDSSESAGSQRARWEGGRIHMRRLWTRPLAFAVLHGEWRLLEPLLDLLSFPLATEALLLALLLAAGLAGHLAFTTAYALLGIAAVVLYVGVTASLAAEPLATFVALLSAPAYLLWKIAMIPRTRLAARPNATWVRTRRNAETAAPTEPEI